MQWKQNTKVTLHIEQGYKSISLVLHIVHLASHCCRTPANLVLYYMPDSKLGVNVASQSSM
jgi:hypothetical protein